MAEIHIVPWREETRKTSGGAALEILETDPVDPGWMHVAERIVVEDETSAYTLLRIGIWAFGRFWPLEEQDSPAAGRIYWLEDAVKIFDGEQIRAQLSGTTSADKLVMRIIGYKKRIA